MLCPCSGTVDELVVHCLKALESTCAEGVELSQANTTVAVVGKDTDFTTYDDDDVCYFGRDLDENVQESGRMKKDLQAPQLSHCQSPPPPIFLKMLIDLQLKKITIHHHITVAGLVLQCGMAI